MDDGRGATYPSWFILPPTHDFLALTGSDFVFAVNCSNNYKRLPASIKNPISWNFSFTGGGQHIPAGLPYPPPPSSPITTQDIAAVNFYR